jgi:hypothetical protein
MRATPVSPNGAQILDPTNRFSAPEHYFLFNNGCLLTPGTFDESKSRVSEAPIAAAGDGVGHITAGPIADIRSSLTGEIIATSIPVTLNLSLNSTVNTDDGGLSFQTVTTGTVVATGVQIAYLHPFYEWASQNAPFAGTALSFTADADGDSLPDGISWALGFEAGQKPKSLRLGRDPVSGNLLMILPGTTRKNLKLETSSSLEPNDWIELSGFVIPEGSDGSIVLPMEVASKGFFRFSTTFE